jgi:hypothetical protein
MTFRENDGTSRVPQFGCLAERINVNERQAETPASGRVQEDVKKRYSLAAVGHSAIARSFSP